MGNQRMFEPIFSNEQETAYESDFDAEGRVLEADQTQAVEDPPPRDADDGNRPGEMNENDVVHDQQTDNNEGNGEADQKEVAPGGDAIYTQRTDGGGNDENGDPPPSGETFKKIDPVWKGKVNDGATIFNIYGKEIVKEENIDGIENLQATSSIVDLQGVSKSWYKIQVHDKGEGYVKKDDITVVSKSGWLAYQYKENYYKKEKSKIDAKKKTVNKEDTVSPKDDFFRELAPAWTGKLQLGTIVVDENNSELFAVDAEDFSVNITAVSINFYHVSFSGIDNVTTGYVIKENVVNINRGAFLRNLIKQELIPRPSSDTGEKKSQPGQDIQNSSEPVVPENKVNIEDDLSALELSPQNVAREIIVKYSDKSYDKELELSEIRAVFYYLLEVKDLTPQEKLGVRRYLADFLNNAEKLEYLFSGPVRIDPDEFHKQLEVSLDLLDVDSFIKRTQKFIQHRKEKGISRKEQKSYRQDYKKAERSVVYNSGFTSAMEIIKGYASIEKEGKSEIEAAKKRRTPFFKAEAQDKNSETSISENQSDEKEKTIQPVHDQSNEEIQPVSNEQDNARMDFATLAKMIDEHKDFYDETLKLNIEYFFAQSDEDKEELKQLSQKYYTKYFSNSKNASRDFFGKENFSGDDFYNNIIEQGKLISRFPENLVKDGFLEDRQVIADRVFRHKYNDLFLHKEEPSLPKNKIDSWMREAQQNNQLPKEIDVLKELYKHGMIPSKYGNAWDFRGEINKLDEAIEQDPSNQMLLDQRRELFIDFTKKQFGVSDEVAEKIWNANKGNPGRLYRHGVESAYIRDGDLEHPLQIWVDMAVNLLEKTVSDTLKLKKTDLNKLIKDNPNIRKIVLGSVGAITDLIDPNTPSGGEIQHLLSSLEFNIELYNKKRTGVDKEGNEVTKEDSLNLFLNNKDFVLKQTFSDLYGNLGIGMPQGNLLDPNMRSTMGMEYSGNRKFALGNQQSGASWKAYTQGDRFSSQYSGSNTNHFLYAAGKSKPYNVNLSQITGKDGWKNLFWQESYQKAIDDQPTSPQQNDQEAANNQASPLYAWSAGLQGKFNYGKFLNVDANMGYSGFYQNSRLPTHLFGSGIKISSTFELPRNIKINASIQYKGNYASFPGRSEEELAAQGTNTLFDGNVARSNILDAELSVGNDMWKITAKASDNLDLNPDYTSVRIEIATGKLSLGLPKGMTLSGKLFLQLQPRNQRYNTLPPFIFYGGGFSFGYNF